MSASGCGLDDVVVVMVIVEKLWAGLSSRDDRVVRRRRRTMGMEVEVVMVADVRIVCWWIERVVRRIERRIGRYCISSIRMQKVRERKAKEEGAEKR